ncbi:MAG TPA: HAMP domain-containing sensor histidine kinase [Gemmatimonadaceae bacterium]|nr:HAMP domain-containing sensor histidine kinase [Gemmatimonadaceae bacterium]
MRVADGNGTSRDGQFIGPGEGERVGLGLLSRFVGAVFLVVLAALLLLDRAQSGATGERARTDASSAALLAEAFVSAHAVLLDRIAEVAELEPPGDSAALRARVDSLVAASPAVRGAWLVDSTGRIGLRVGRQRVPLDDRLAAIVVERVRRRRAAAGTTAVAVSRDSAAGRLISFTRELRASTGGATGAAGLVVDADSLRSLLGRVQPATRRSLLVLSGRDTLVQLGSAEASTAHMGAGGSPIVRLPDGGTWRVVSAHALTSPALRWGLWIFGGLGVLLLAIGLFREQQRALQVAGRSMELERLYSDVKRANQAKSEFLANVSHELRTPLNAIVGFVELLRDGFYGDLSPRQIPPVDRIAASATHLRHLVDQVLDIAKIAAGRLEVHPETIVLRPFVLNVASELESLVSEKGLAFSITVGASLPRVRTDPTHLRQILINLIGNAVKYTPAGTVSVRARLLGGPPVSNAHLTPTRSSVIGADDASARSLLARAPRSGTWVVLQVVDSGVGIAPADLERIFDEFEQVNAGPRGDSMQRGTGLGLAISRRLARLLGGDVSVESEIGRGSTFTVWLPVNPADLHRERSPAGGTPTVATPASGASAV